MGRWAERLRQIQNPIQEFNDNRANSANSPPPTRPIGTNDAIVRPPLEQFPGEWSNGADRLLEMAWPRLWTPGRWSTLVDDASTFMRVWAGRAAALGWGTLDVFGVDPRAPETGWHLMGLVVLLDGAEIVVMTEEGARLRLRSGIQQSFRRPDADGAVPVWNVS